MDEGAEWVVGIAVAATAVSVVKQGLSYLGAIELTPVVSRAHKTIQSLLLQ